MIQAQRRLPLTERLLAVGLRLLGVGCVGLALFVVFGLLAFCAIAARWIVQTFPLVG